jgi:hypothetical protein
MEDAFHGVSIQYNARLFSAAGIWGFRVQADGGSGSRSSLLAGFQMLSLRSLAFILCSAMRASRAALLCFPDRSKTAIMQQKMAPDMDAKMAKNRAASMSVSCG